MLVLQDLETLGETFTTTAFNWKFSTTRRLSLFFFLTTLISKNLVNFMLRLERYIHTPETGLILLTVKYCQKTLHLRCLRGSWFVLNYFFLRLNNIIISTRINLFSKFSDGHDTMGHLNKFGASCTKKNWL